jgi:NADP-dependent 3-hydroxy acid dehydrogenase YdfG
MSQANGETRVVAISGAGTGIGRITAVKFGELGWDVALGGRRVDKLEETAELVKQAGGRPFVHRLDVADPTSVEEFFTATEGSLGTVTAVINNAGVARYFLLEEAPADEIESEIAIKLCGSLYMARRGIIGMKNAGTTGDILFVTSLVAALPWPYQLVYAAASAGVAQAAQVLRMELEGSGIRVNDLRVGQTSGTDFAVAELESGRLMAAHPEWFRRGLLAHTGLMEPDDVAAAIVAQVTAPVGVQYDVVLRPVAPVGPAPQTLDEYFVAMMSKFMPAE